MKRLQTITLILAAMFLCGCNPTIDIPDPDQNKPEKPQEQEKPQEPEKPTGPQLLKGTVIGTQYSVDYTTNAKSTTINTKKNVFDGNHNTYFASYDRSQTWVGLDLGEKHVITKVGWAPRIDYQDRVQLALFEGANKPDFSDALPIYIVKDK
ncbi:MAG: hypothetical protein IIX08_08330, partial [Bacteroidales bacterium]|nr:hypothetical protein [Bacteroidales bacterium]